MEIRTIDYKVTPERFKLPLAAILLAAPASKRGGKPKSFITPCGRRHGLQPPLSGGCQGAKVARFTFQLNTVRRPHLPWDGKSSSLQRDFIRWCRRLRAARWSDSQFAKRLFGPCALPKQPCSEFAKVTRSHISPLPVLATCEGETLPIEDLRGSLKLPLAAPCHLFNSVKSAVNCKRTWR